MLDAVALFGALGVVEAVQRADQIAGDTADTMERLVLIVIGELDVVAVDADVDGIGLTAVELGAAGDVGVYLFLRADAAGDVDLTHGRSSLHILCLCNYYTTKDCDVKRYISESKISCTEVNHGFRIA